MDTPSMIVVGLGFSFILSLGLYMGLQRYKQDTLNKNKKITKTKKK